MGTVDRRGFFRLARRSEPAAEETPEPEELSLRAQQTRAMAELSSSLLAQVAGDEAEQVADGAVLTKAFDDAYMRVTDKHIVFSIATGFQVAVKVEDVRTFDTEPPEELSGYGNLVTGLLRAHHPADPPAVTRSYAFRFLESSPLPAAIREVTGIPEPEPEAEPEPEPEPEAS